MWDKGVENRTGLDAKGFLIAMLDHFAAFTAMDWLVFSLKLGVFIFIFFMIPNVLDKLGFKGWVPPVEKDKE